ncbi:MAG TPA: alpha-ketoglutarate-dependent dioxygenase AlkB, partial [Vicinamibacteria bacterium]|nr:alpha-ketoglutarate-dependent dioxygenase AlkB [Vicinamibacteria bacterium]
MVQLPLFEPVPGHAPLADDEWGRLAYRPGLVPVATARRWFDELRRAVRWNAERRWMYDRQVDVPRLTAHFRLQPAPDQPAPPAAALEAAERVIAETGVAFDSVGLNLYRDGRDSVAPHNDHLDEIAPGFPIALLSLGSTRRMTIRAKPPRRRVIHLDLEAGSLLLMSYETQLHYTHGVPKTTEPVGERISLALRVKPKEQAAGRASGGDRY